MSLDRIGTEELSRKILLHSRRRISHIAPILLEAVYALPEKARPLPGPLSTDGCTLWFDPATVVEDFRKERDSVARQLLHIISHCLLGHPEARDGYPISKAFDCAADLKAAQLAAGLCGTSFAANNCSHDCPADVENAPCLRPLYEAIQKSDYTGQHWRQSAKAVCFDDHGFWSSTALAAEAAGTSDNGTFSQSNHSGDGRDNHLGQPDRNNSPHWDRIRQSMLDGNGGKLPGNCAGMLTENFSVPDRGMSYAAFLKRFASPEERMLLDPDSFDVRWYHLGMEYYGDIPLLEPSEISEPPLPDDIVIALDTSGSCCGEVCKRFLKETLGLLRDLSAGASRFHVWLLQCDTEIQQEVLLETSEQVDELFRSFTARGFGGTDFRPVFDRVARLRQEGTLPRVRGLLYLTDGWGSYPAAPTDYPTVFLIPAEERGYLPSGTQWITRLYLNETDYTLKEASAT